MLAGKGRVYAAPRVQFWGCSGVFSILPPPGALSQLGVFVPLVCNYIHLFDCAFLSELP